jgi:hypothetical protein
MNDDDALLRAANAEWFVVPGTSSQDANASVRPCAGSVRITGAVDVGRDAGCSLVINEPSVGGGGRGRPLW